MPVCSAKVNGKQHGRKGGTGTFDPQGRGLLAPTWLSTARQKHVPQSGEDEREAVGTPGSAIPATGRAVTFFPRFAQDIVPTAEAAHGPWLLRMDINPPQTPGTHSLD